MVAENKMLPLDEKKSVNKGEETQAANVDEPSVNAFPETDLKWGDTTVLFLKYEYLLEDPTWNKLISPQVSVGSGTPAVEMWSGGENVWQI